MAELTVQIRYEFRPWAKKLLAIASRMPLLFAWIGVERLAQLIARHGVTVYADFKARGHKALSNG